MFLQAATAYLEKYNFSVIPVGPDKKPLISWKDYQKRKPTRDELKELVFEESTIAAREICDPNSPEFIGVWERITDEYDTYVAEQLGG